MSKLWRGDLDNCLHFLSEGAYRAEEAVDHGANLDGHEGFQAGAQAGFLVETSEAGALGGRSFSPLETSGRRHFTGGL